MDTEQVIRSLTDRLKPVRPLAPARVRARRWSAFALAAVVLGTLLVGLPPGSLSRIGDARFVSASALLVALAVVCGRLAFELGTPGGEPPAAARALPLLGALTWAFLAADVHSESLGPAAPGWRCVARMASLALLPCIAAFSMLRRAAPLQPGWTGVFALLGVASFATLGMQLACVKDDPAHVIRWHLCPLLACILLGALLGRCLLAHRRRAGLEVSP